MRLKSGKVTSEAKKSKKKVKFVYPPIMRVGVKRRIPKKKDLRFVRDNKVLKRNCVGCVDKLHHFSTVPAERASSCTASTSSSVKERNMVGTRKTSFLKILGLIKNKYSKKKEMIKKNLKRKVESEKKNLKKTSEKKFKKTFGNEKKKLGKCGETERKNSKRAEVARKNFTKNLVKGMKKFCTCCTKCNGNGSIQSNNNKETQVSASQIQDNDSMDVAIMRNVARVLDRADAQDLQPPRPRPPPPPLPNYPGQRPPPLLNYPVTSTGSTSASTSVVSTSASTSVASTSASTSSGSASASTSSGSASASTFSGSASASTSSGSASASTSSGSTKAGPMPTTSQNTRSPTPRPCSLELPDAQPVVDPSVGLHAVPFLPRYFVGNIQRTAPFPAGQSPPHTRNVHFAIVMNPVAQLEDREVVGAFMDLLRHAANANLDMAMPRVHAIMRDFVALLQFGRVDGVHIRPNLFRRGG